MAYNVHLLITTKYHEYEDKVTINDASQVAISVSNAIVEAAVVAESFVITITKEAETQG